MKAAAKKKSVSIGKLSRLVKKMIRVERENLEIIRAATLAAVKAAVAS